MTDNGDLVLMSLTQDSSAIETTPPAIVPGVEDLASNEVQAAPPEGEASMLIPPPTTGEVSSVRDTASTILMFAGLVLLAMTIWRMLRKSWRIRQGGSRVTKYEEPGMGAEPRLRMAEIEQRAAKRDEMDGVVSNSEEVVRRLVAHLEAKSLRLELLMDRAEACAERLERAAAGVEQSTNSTPSPVSRSSPGAVGRRESDLGEPVDQGGWSPASTSPVTGIESLEREIVTLADQGLVAAAIAARLEQPIGQVELVLALRRRSSA